MSKIRVVYNPDKTVNIIYPAPNSRHFSLTAKIAERIKKDPGLISKVPFNLIPSILNNQKCVRALEYESENPGTFVFEDESEWLERAFAKTMEKSGFIGLEYDDIDQVDIPKERADRDAWEGEKGKGVFVNATKMSQLRDEKERRKLIEEEKNAILEAQAIQSLKDKGLL